MFCHRADDGLRDRRRRVRSNRRVVCFVRRVAPCRTKPHLRRLMMTAAVIAAAVLQMHPTHTWGRMGTTLCARSLGMRCARRRNSALPISAPAPRRGAIFPVQGRHERRSSAARAAIFTSISAFWRRPSSASASGSRRWSCRPAPETPASAAPNPRPSPGHWCRSGSRG